MRLAILADIHGNLAAFEAALEHVHMQSVDQIIIAGDIVNGAPDSSACLDLAESLGYPLLRGNHERYAADFGTPAAPPEWNDVRFAPLRWTVRQLGDQRRFALRDLPLAWRTPDAPELLVVHASPRSDYDTILAYTAPDALQAMFEGVQETLVVRAHNHAPQVRIWNGKTIVTTGSVGLALDGHPTAQYLILERRHGGWEIQHQSLPYDLDATIRRFHETGYLEETGPIGRLYLREVVTASFMIVPFLRMYEQWRHEQPLSLAAALERFERL